jgi:hypothetical protein
MKMPLSVSTLEQGVRHSGSDRFPNRRDFLRDMAMGAIAFSANQSSHAVGYSELTSPAWLQTDEAMWGLRNGMEFAIHPAGFGEPDGGPRGLIRVGSPVRPDGGHALVNFIAIEPVVAGQRGFSELEFSALDRTQGKRFWADAARISSPEAGIEQLDVPINVEPFSNGARVRLTVSQRNDAPDEIRITVHAVSGSLPIATCILTATMGNLARTRRLWLRDEVVSSTQLYPEFREDGFAPHTVYLLPRLARKATDDVIVAVTGDESDPATLFPFPGSPVWHYGGVPVTQYWKVDKDAVHDDLQAAVNARYAYWKSRRPIPGGVAFENCELRTSFRNGQSFVFGVTRATPSEMGINPRTGRDGPAVPAR